MRIGIGIDTGGTCTDAVAFDYQTNTVLAKGKALTTKNNLEIGISNALDKLPEEYIQNAEIVALSTTLATNSCVENKGCRAKLFIFGLGDEHLHSESFNAAKYGIRPEYIRGIDTHSTADGLNIDEPDWDLLFEQYGDWMSDAEAMTAAELYGTTSGAPCEKKFKKLVEEKLGIECVCAYEINDKINVIARGATALLNSRLFPIIREFIGAAKKDFEERGCKAPITVVRSDGTLMSAELSMTRPVETILSGPSASVCAGKSLTDSPDYMIIDMGGTTTDVSIVRDGRPLTAGSGIRIGSWKTLVSGVFVDTFALGGDTTIRIDKKEIQILTRRAMPVCSAAARWPYVKECLKRELTVNSCGRNSYYEFLYLIREPADHSRYSEREQQVMAALKDGPVMIRDIPEKTGIELYLLDTVRLENEGVLIRCALTPTDMMHIKGDYNEYDAEASLLAVRCALNAWGMTYQEEGFVKIATEEDACRFADEVYDRIRFKMYRNLVRILMAQQYPRQFEKDLDDQMSFIAEQIWKTRNEEGFRMSDLKITTDLTLVGVGAPTHIFLPEVAKALGTDCVIPEHAEVANAFGALKADIYVKIEIDVSMQLRGGYLYIVHSPEGSVATYDLNEAYELGIKAAHDKARDEAIRRGASGEPEVRVYVKNAENNADSLYCGGTIIGEAVSRRSSP